MSRTRTALRWAYIAAIVYVLCISVHPAVAQAGGTTNSGNPSVQKVDPKAFTKDFSLYMVDLSPTGSNPFFILEPGYRLVLGNEDVTVIITVLDKTKTIGGVVTRVVEEREFENGQLIELSLNYFVISLLNNSVFYFGEDVDIFENGKVVSHEGSWRAGRNGAKPGLIMPGIVLLGAKYFQELAAGVALDKAEVVGVNETYRVPAGLFRGVIRTRETTSLEPGAKDFKLYAPGVGLIQDADIQLLEYGFVM